MGFVHHHQIPGGVPHIIGLASGKLVGTDDNGILGFEGAEVAELEGGIVGLGFKNLAGQEKFLIQFLIPLFPQVGRGNDEDAAFALGPFLGKDQTGLNRLAQTDFVGQQRTFGQWGAEREQCRVHLMRIQVHLRTGDGVGELFNTV